MSNSSTSQVPPSKRPKLGDDVDETNAHNHDHQTVSVCEDALFHAMAYLHPRDLYNMAFTCTSLRDQISTPLVVRSAMIHGGHTGSTINHLLPLMEKGKIHIPSPLRLLRLVNGKKCEFCNCRKVNHVRPGYGVFACWFCTTERGLTRVLNTKLVRYNRNRKYDAMFNHERVGLTPYGSKYYVWNVRRTSVGSSGEAIGPLVTFRHIDASVQGNLSIDDYLEQILEVPPLEDYTEFVSICQEMKARAKKAEEERYEKKEATAMRTKENRKKKVDQMIAKLAALLEEPWREDALKYKETKIRVWFDSPLVDNLLKVYVIAPSKMRKKILQEIAESINASFSLIRDKGFITYEFLSEEDAFESALKRCCLTSLNSYTSFLMSCTKKFFDFLERDRLFDALVYLKGYDFGYLLLSQSESSETISSTRASNMRKLSSKVWTSELSKAASGVERRFSTAFTASKASFRTAKLALADFEAWLQKKRGNAPCIVISYTMEQLCHGEFESCIGHLLKRDFQRAYEIGSAGFERWYG